MSPSQLRATLARLGLTQSEAARLLGVDDRTMRRWCCAERGIPEPVARLLWLLLRHGTADLADWRPRWPVARDAA